MAEKTLTTKQLTAENALRKEENAAIAKSVTDATKLISDAVSTIKELNALIEQFGEKTWNDSKPAADIQEKSGS